MNGTNGNRQIAVNAATVQYVIAIVVIVALGIGGAVYTPDQAVAILAFCGSILVALLAILKGQTEVQKGQADVQKVQAELHSAVNSKMDKLLAEVAKTAKAEGIADEIIRQKISAGIKAEGKLEGAAEQKIEDAKPPTH